MYKQILIKDKLFRSEEVVGHRRGPRRVFAAGRSLPGADLLLVLVRAVVVAGVFATIVCGPGLAAFAAPRPFTACRSAGSSVVKN
mgnify:CR=1 FL=1